jgi:multiple sugar transport system substrate-binding protein
MTFSIKRRTLLASGLAGLVAGSLSTRLAFAQEKRLRFFWWGNQERLNRTQAALDIFTKAHPDVQIDGETAPFDDFFPRLATQVVGGNPPDLVQMDFRYIAEYAHRGALLDLDPYLGKALDLSEIPTDQVDANRVDGKLYGVSFGVNSAALMVNEDAWGEVDAKAPYHGMTYEEFAENCARLSKDTKRDSFYGTSDASGNDIAMENWLKQQGKGLYTTDGKLAYTAEDAGKWFALWAGMRDSGACVPADMQALDLNTIETSMVTLGHAATSFQLANSIGPQQNAVQEKIAPQPYPLFAAGAAPGQYLRPATRLSVTSATKYPDDAVALLAFLTGNVEAAKILGADRGIPSAPSLAKAISPTLKPAEKISVDYIASLAELVGPLPPALPPGAGEITKLVHDISQPVAFGNMSPEDGGGALVSGANDVLNRT